MFSITELDRTEFSKYGDFLCSRSLESIYSYFGVAMSHATIRRLVSNMQESGDGHHIFLCYYGNEIIGSVHVVQLEGERAELGLMVSEYYRHQGVGALLVSKAKEVCKTLGIHNLFVEIVTYNTPMRRLAAKMDLEIMQT